MTGRAAGDRPLTYKGEHDLTVTYLPRDLVRVARTPYLALAKTVGESPASTPSSWLQLGGDSEHPGVGPESVAVGHSAVADDSSTSVGFQAGNLGKQYAVAVGHSSGGGDESVTVGEGCDSAADYVVGVGRNASPDAPSAVAVGYQALVNSGAASGVAVGREAHVIGADGVAVGYLAAVANGVAVGQQAAATGVGGSVAVGPENVASGSHSTAVGPGASATADFSVALGFAGATEPWHGVVGTKVWEARGEQDGTGSFLAVRDTSDVRWLIGVTTGGALTVAVG